MDPARYILSEAELRDRKSQKVTQSSPTYGEASDLVSVLGFLDRFFSFTQPISKYIPVGECWEETVVTHVELGFETFLTSY